MPTKKKETPSAKTRKKGRKKKAGSKSGEDTDRVGQASEQESFPIVGIGASAGGLPALEAFFTEMPADCGMAFVIIQHLDPHHESLMNALLSKKTGMKVNDAADGMKVRPGQVYIKPPGEDIVIENRTLMLREIQEKERPRLPIDTFFRSLAEDQKEKAICIVLSGASNDGTLGAKLIKGEGGMVMVQDEKEAQYPSMPKSVIDAGLADIIIPMEQMPEELLRYVEHPFMIREPVKEAEESIEQAVQSVLMLVRTNTGHDFSQYKRSTVLRRIERRMALHRIHEMGDYKRFLRQSPDEVEALFKDLTINVTSFFRDAHAFASLKENVIKPMLERIKTDTTLRIWVPGCSSGEEAYSIAIMMVEMVEAMETYFEIKIFGSDINNDAIETARTGLFPDNIAADLSEERIKCFFSKKGPRYQVDSKIRDMMVFAVHDLIRDPPFSNMDLVSCRNILIYMDNDLQKKVLPILHYALKPGGILFLGTSETPGERSKLFTVVDKKSRIYRREEGEAGHLKHFHVSDTPLYPAAVNGDSAEGKVAEVVPVHEKRGEVRKVIEQAILKKYAPPAVLLDEQSNILYFHGNTGRYLSVPSGEPSFNIFNMVGGELHYRLSQAVEHLKRERKPLSMNEIQVRHNDDFLSLDVILTPIASRGRMKDWMLLEFNEQKPPETIKPGEPPPDDEEGAQESQVANLQARLKSTRQELQAVIEELETSNEELKSANEELQANNEELQSTNEELESSKEELQSTNEELETVNTELFKKNQDLMKVEDDLRNLFASTEIGTIFLDNELRIERFTPAATKVFNLEEQRDIGRKLSDITNTLRYERLSQDAEEVLDKLTRKELRVRGERGESYVIRIIPYRTNENIIEGLALTFLDLDLMKESDSLVYDFYTFLKNTTTLLWEPIVVLDEDLKVSMANRAFYRTFKTSQKETENLSIFELSNNQWDIPDLRLFLEDIIPLDKEFEGYEVEHEFPRIGWRKFSLNARKVEEWGGKSPSMIILSFRDITGT